MNLSVVSDLVHLGEGFSAEFKYSGTSGLGREKCAFADATYQMILVGRCMMEKNVELASTIV